MADRDPGAPKRWLDEDDASGAERRRLLREGTGLRPFPAARQEAVWTGAQQKLSGAGTFAWWKPLIAAAALVVMIVATSVVTRGPRTLPIGDLGRVVLSDDARVTAAPTLVHPELDLASGSIDAQIYHRPPGQPFMVVTPQVHVIVVGTHFSVQVDSSRTVVAVQEGRVRVESPEAAVFVSAGESVTSDDPRLRAPAPAPVAPRTSNDPTRMDRRVAEVPQCSQLSSDSARDTCFSQVASRGGLDAENALVSQALERRDRGDLAGAVAALDAYQSRFPNGLFGPEVAFERVHELADSGRYADARTAAENVEHAFPSDPRTPGISLLRAQVLREHLADPADAVELARKLVSSGPKELQEPALYELGLSQDASHSADVASTWHKYLQEFPNGPHAQAVKARLGP